ncbi:hypothetical protein ACFXJ8_26050 [Nonomuraea sp. NPDC059194]|uniref:hypothetical protein n=1 Tax=Nonomuraea sp. NPDC059194 TaxID=3346764 RepID=UPI0036859FDF
MPIDLPFHPLTGLKALGLRRNGEPIWPILGASDDHDEDDSGEEESTEETSQGDEDESDDKDKPLGPAGEKALAAEKEKRKAAASQARAEKARADAAEAELAKMRRAAERSKPKAEDKPDAQEDAPDVEEIQRNAEQAALAKANERIIRAEIRAAAAGKLADPRDALSFLDLTKFEVDADGNVDADEVADAIEDLLKNKPYLAVAQGDGKRFKGSGDGGAKPNKPTRSKSLTEAVTKALSPS